MTVEYAAPPPAGTSAPPRDLAWISVAFIACWGALLFLYGQVQVVGSLIYLHNIADPFATHGWPDPVPMWLAGTLFLLGVLSLNLLVPGVVIGVVAILRARPRAYVRVVAFLVLVAGGVVGAFWVDSLEFDPTGPMGGIGGEIHEFLGSGGLSGALVAAVCAAATLGSAYLVLARPSGGGRL